MQLDEIGRTPLRKAEGTVARKPSSQTVIQTTARFVQIGLISGDDCSHLKLWGSRHVASGFPTFFLYLLQTKGRERAKLAQCNFTLDSDLLHVLHLRKDIRG